MEQQNRVPAPGRPGRGRHSANLPRPRAPSHQGAQAGQPGRRRHVALHGAAGLASSQGRSAQARPLLQSRQDSQAAGGSRAEPGLGRTAGGGPHAPRSAKAACSQPRESLHVLAGNGLSRGNVFICSSRKPPSSGEKLVPDAGSLPGAEWLQQRASHLHPLRVRTGLPPGLPAWAR